MIGLLAVLRRLRNLVGDGVVRIVLLVVVSAAVAVLVGDWSLMGSGDRFEVGDVAPRTVKAPRSFTYLDAAERQRRQDQARAAEQPVFLFRSEVADEQAEAIARAFGDARLDLEALQRDLDDLDGSAAEPTSEDRQALRDLFRDRLGASLSDGPIDALLDAGFPPAAEALAMRWTRGALEGYVVADRDALADAADGLTVLRVSTDSREERALADTSVIADPAQARGRVDMARAATDGDERPWLDAVSAVARAMVRPNLRYAPAETERRRALAAGAVAPVEVVVKRGTVLFRDGEVLEAPQIRRYEALLASSTTNIGLAFVAIASFLALLMASFVHFGSTYLARFSTRLRDLVAVAVLLVGSAAGARAVVAASDGIASLLGNGAAPQSVWYVLPLAGAAMLVRLLVGVEWSVVFAIVASAVAGLAMDLDALVVVFYLLSSVAGAGAVEHTRERLGVLRAGLFTGVVNAATVLLVALLQRALGDGDATQALGFEPVWSMAFAFGGGLLSAFVVLGLMPLFESAGFVTDYRLLELANLNHPLMRQLMLRAPGSYHHSVVVGSLAEAGCEAIGANALQARVAAYFHDIGKALKPQYFVENQGAANSRHDHLDPYASARIIISHVTDGARMAREHRMPQPILDNIYMHHGTGLLHYFYAKAVEEAGSEADVDEAAFRYPGPKPDNREAGVLMLADKVEAATRTIKEPTEEKFRSMIHAIINSVMADGQFDQCPLTFREMYTVTDAFVGVLVGIHHQRVEYPQTKAISSGDEGASEAADPPARKRKIPPIGKRKVITLELPSPLAKAPPTDAATARPAPGSGYPSSTGDSTLDYEAVQHLPGSEIRKLARRRRAAESGSSDDDGDAS